MNRNIVLSIVSMLLSFIVLILCPTIVLPIIKADPQKQRIYADPLTTRVNIGQTFMINVTIANVTDLYGYEFTLFWKNTVLSCVKAIRTPPWKEGIDFAPPPQLEQNYNSTHGRYICGSAPLSSPPFTGSISVATLVFNAAATGNSTLALCNIILLHASGDVMPHEAVDGFVEVVKMLSDVNNDGKVDIKDIYMVAKAFGSTPEHPRWNRDVDLDGNEIVNISDVLMVAKDFGKTY